MTTLREKIEEALDNANRNEYFFDNWTVDQIVDDLVSCDADLEREDPVAIKRELENILQDRAEKQMERLMEDGPGKTLLEQQQEAMKYK